MNSKPTKRADTTPVKKLDPHGQDEGTTLPHSNESGNTTDIDGAANNAVHPLERDGTQPRAMDRFNISHARATGSTSVKSADTLGHGDGSSPIHYVEAAQTIDAERTANEASRSMERDESRPRAMDRRTEPPQARRWYPV